VEVQLLLFLTSALGGGERSAPGSHSAGGWVGPKTGLDAMEQRKSLILTGNRTPIPRLPTL
jgi:hypothetical protein